jgi:hypothetical protein
MLMIYEVGLIFNRIMVLGMAHTRELPEKKDKEKRATIQNSWKSIDCMDRRGEAFAVGLLLSAELSANASPLT